jgi:hypothetical protein
MTRTSLWLARIVVFVVSGLLTLTVLEVFVRATGRDRAIVWRPDPVLGWWHVPGSQQHWTSEGDGWVKINAVGLRDVERSVQKPPGVIRIGVFGDSMTEGVQVNLDQTFCQILERKLRERTGRQIEVLNYGVNGYGPLQAYLMYKNVGKAFSPDVVVHAMFTDNDVADSHPRLSVTQGAPVVRASTATGLDVDYEPAISSHADYLKQPVAFIRRHSALYRLASIMRYRWIEWSQTLEARKANAGVPRRFLLYADPLPEQWQSAWKTAEEVIRTFNDDVRADGSRYILVSLPAGQVVNPEAWAELLEQFPAMKTRPWNLRDPEARVTAIAARHGVRLISGLSTYESSPERRELYFYSAGHFTPRGHQVMAGILEDELLRHELQGLSSPTPN